MRFATAIAIIVTLATIEVAEAQSPPKIVFLSEADASPPTHTAKVKMVPVKVQVEFNNPAELAFKLSDTGIDPKFVTYLPNESPRAGVHTFRLAALPRGKFTFIAYSGKLASREFLIEVEDPPTPVIVAIYEEGGVPVSVPSDRTVKLSDLKKPFFVVVERFEPGDKWAPYVDGNPSSPAVAPVENRIVKVTLDKEHVKDKAEVQFRLRLHRNGWGSDLSVSVKLQGPPPPPKPAPSPPKVEPKAPPEAQISYPFWDAPQVFRVRMDGDLFQPRRDDGEEKGASDDRRSDCCKPPLYCSLKECAKKEGLATWRKRLPTSANFPQLRFGESGECIETSGAIIYEDMQLTVAKDGRYEVTFNASTPRVPVTIRLTLLVRRTDSTVQLTLPAVALVPNYRSEQEVGAYTLLSNNYQENWHVRHMGFSPDLRDLYAHGFTDDHDGRGIHLHRDGVARFGSLPLSR